MPRGVAVIAHPHPLFAGTMDNKVVQTLARAFVQSGWRVVRFNFRGVGATEGTHDAGRGVLQDLMAVIDHATQAGSAMQVPLALAEFVRVLKPDGRVLITCPDLQSVCARVAQGELASPLYESDAGPISALDIMYGHRGAMAAGNLFMAHRCGFTLQVLADTLQACGFPRTAGIARPEAFDLWVVASKAALSDAEIRALAVLHLPRRG